MGKLIILLNINVLRIFDEYLTGLFMGKCMGKLIHVCIYCLAGLCAKYGRTSGVCFMRGKVPRLEPAFLRSLDW